MSRAGTALVLCLAVASGIRVQPCVAQRSAGWIQAEGFYHYVTNDFGDWKGAALRALVPSGPLNLWYGDLVAQEAFDDFGVYAAISNRHTFSPRWFSFASVGGGTGDFFFPDLRADLSVGTTWLEQRNLVTIIGATYVNSKDIYEDFALHATVAGYFPGLTAEIGGRLNWSWPDAVTSERLYGALTVGRERQRLIVFRGGGGTEGYQLTGDIETQRRFTSYEASVSWREWLSGRVGLFAAGEWYDNPFYTRTGVTLGVFRHW